MANQEQKKGKRDEFEGDDVFQAPEIVREPSSRQAKLGARVVLRITATGRPLPSFQWFHNGKKISGANTDRLTLVKVRRTAGGAYHCEAKNHAGKAVSRQCMLSFFTQKIPQIVIAPLESKLEEGKAYVLKVTAPEAKVLRDLKIYWTYNGKRIKGALGPKLTISAVKKKYEGEYKAMISVGPNLETSNVAKLTVVPAKAKPLPIATPVPQDDDGEGTMVISSSVLAEEVGPEPEAIASVVAAPVARWEDSLFDPDGEESFESENPEVFNLMGSFENTSPGNSPLSQLSTRDLIRELDQVDGDDPVTSADPSPLLESLEAGATASLMAEWNCDPEPAAKAKAMPEPSVAVKIPPIVNLKLVQKKEFLENFLSRWQSRAEKKIARAA